MINLPTVQGSNISMDRDGKRFSIDIDIDGIAVGSIDGVIGDADSGSFNTARDMVLRYKKATKGARSRVGNSYVECVLRLDVLHIVASAACCKNPSPTRLFRNA